MEGPPDTRTAITTQVSWSPSRRPVSIGFTRSSMTAFGCWPGVSARHELVQRTIHIRTLYSLDRLLDGDRLYSKMSHKRPIVRENDKERRRYCNGINT